MARPEPVDIEVLTLFLGYTKASQLVGLPEDSLKELLSELSPHPFFAFFRDSILVFIHKVGICEVSRRLGIREEVLRLLTAKSS